MTAICYKEAGLEMRIDSEILIGSRGLRVYAESIRQWENPNHHIPVANACRTRILENIRAAFRSRGFEIETIGPRNPEVADSCPSEGEPPLAQWQARPMGHVSDCASSKGMR
jgi:hypothetical protein